MVASLNARAEWLHAKEVSFIDSDRKYWQVTGIVKNACEGACEGPEQTRFLHGRFSWEKKTFA